METFWSVVFGEGMGSKMKIMMIGTDKMVQVLFHQQYEQDALLLNHPLHEYRDD